jgi:hypothetical protein
VGVKTAIGEEDPRLDPRSNVFLMASVSDNATSNPVKVRNLSIYGALLEGPALPQRDAPARLRRGSLQISGTIAWRDKNHCGIRFDFPIDVEEWVKRVGSQEQQAIDATIADIRGGLVKTDLAGMRASNRIDLLARASGELSGICERIAAMPGMSLELAEELVKLDALAHSLKCAR